MYSDKGNQRVVVGGGWSELSNNNASDKIYSIPSVSHQWLFEKVAGVVHHGGCGTTATGLHAGKPTFIVHFVADQPFLGMRVFKSGAGPHPVFYKKLTTEILAQALNEMSMNRSMILC